MWNKVFIEESLKKSKRAVDLAASFKAPTEWIHSYEDFFQKAKKPYLQKRNNLNVFIAKKKGSLVKMAPESYGSGSSPHYYFIHAYNCIYECQYCYLQGYFHSPDLVLFVNHEEIIEEIRAMASETKGEKWFHAGEFSDSLALSHLTNEWPLYWQAFKEMPEAILELRTKSANIKAIESLEPLQNIIITFSLSPQPAIKTFDLKTAPLQARLRAMKRLAELGHPLGIHFDPIVVNDNVLSQYKELISDLLEHLEPEQIRYISLGVVRFTKDVFYQMQQNYPDSALLGGPLKTSFDGKVRYPRPLRLHLLTAIKKALLEKGFHEKQIYFCMERD